ncbi:hypothetical protein GJA_5561 [Janthinobacterium agaricidamnosum NBRC 102515 = DSM 9628]|uniref:Uncharacterized protein n=1 Tax=Janthinobacterium agaricidamnosum NBRC 102515 = DSM 9628 TaxID=1349767 RepID=W0VF99_9BURK|nr:hypothetical protein GJA_5561 [Janthinobacterium agaricidamnosum NBRC 102515 = DSM 9628]
MKLNIFFNCMHGRPDYRYRQGILIHKVSHGNIYCVFFAFCANHMHAIQILRILFDIL